MSVLDENPYMADGLLVLEGMTPGFRFAPAAAMTWPSFAYGAAAWVVEIAFPSGDVQAPPILRPVVALDQALFEIYSDLTGLRGVLIAWSIALTSLAALGLAWLGARRAGWLGAVLTGGLFGLLPIIVVVSVQGRPYGAAWSLGALAVVAAGIGRGNRRLVASGGLLGLAIATRIEMLLLAPLIGWEFWLRRDRDRSLGASLAALLAVALVSASLAAPWYVTHLVGNLRKIVTVSVYTSRIDPTGPVVIDMLWWQGMALFLPLLAVGLALQTRRDGNKAVALGGYLLLLLVAGSFGIGPRFIMHQGYLLVGLVASAPYALRGLASWIPPGRRGWLVLVVLSALALPAYRTALLVAAERAGWVEHDAVDWIEEHVPPGTKIFFSTYNTRIPLPTTRTSDSLWNEVAGSDAWRHNLERRLPALGFALGFEPRALSFDHLVQQQGKQRRFFILGGPYQPDRPRYEFHFLPNIDPSLAEYRAHLIEFCRGRGVLWHYGPPLDALTGWERAWLAPNGTGVFLYDSKRACPLRPAEAGGGL